MRGVLIIFLSFVALTAIPAGLLLIADPGGGSMGMSADLLSNTPFHSFFVPGLILLLIVGGSAMIGLFLIIIHSWWSYRIALTSGIILMIWILDELIFIPDYHWIQGLYLAIGILISLTAYQLMGKAAF